MQPPEAPVIAEGETPAGERWYLYAAGTSDDYWTMLKTFYSDGEGGGAGAFGPALSADSPFYFTIGHYGDDKPLSMVIRTENRVRRVRLRSPQGMSRDLLPVADDAAVGVTFFVGLLPWADTNIAIEGFDANGQLLHQHLPEPY